MTDADRYHIAPQPSVNAAYVLDLKPLIAWFRDMLSEARTAAADAKCEARGHRERVVELEAKLQAALEERDSNTEAFAAQQELLVSLTRKLDELQGPRIELDYKAMLADKRAEWDEQAGRYVAQIKNLEKRAEMAENKLAKAHCERDEALERAHKAEDRWSECAERTQAPRAEFTPGSTAAVVEAYRLLVGNEPTWEPDHGWDDAVSGVAEHAYKAGIEMLRHLNEIARGGRP